MLLASASEILKAIRALMVARAFVAYIVPYSGQHYSETSAPCEQRIAAISNFTGSSARVVITEGAALLWTDGRYFDQAENQLDTEYWTLMRDGEDPTETEWLKANLPDGSVVGVDGMLYPKSTFDKMAADLLDGDGIVLRDDLAVNLIDSLEDDIVTLPECPKKEIIELDETLAGKSVAEKLKEVTDKMTEENVDLLLLSELDEIAWLFNLRGTDLPPVFYAYAMIGHTSSSLLIQDVEFPEDVKVQLERIDVTVQPGDYANAATVFQTEIEKETVNSVWVSKYVNYRMASVVTTPENDRVVVKLSPVSLLKAIKNPTEVIGMKNAHLRESAAIIAYLSWLQTEVQGGRNDLTEISAAAELDKIRALARPENHFVENYGTISASGRNAAIIHYFATEETNSLVNTSYVYLMDTMGQYQDGTTDTTRTVHFGVPTATQKEMFTRVLKGHIAIATAVFPKQTTGHQLDALARQSLWDVNKNYAHGTGHGIGHYLNVHEGPQRMTYTVSEDDTGLEANMFMSNEPGYYDIENDYGFRLENIVQVKEVEGTGGEYLTFETIAFVPIQLSLIDNELLTAEEIAWLDEYHVECLDKITDYVNSVTYLDEYKAAMLTWLEQSTTPWNIFHPSSAMATVMSTFTILSSLIIVQVLTKYLM